MNLRKTVAVAAVLLGVGLSSTACRQEAAPSQPPATGPTVAPHGSDAAMPPELRDIQTTLDAIDSEVAGDGSG
jgi:hypothetical protein